MYIDFNPSLEIMGYHAICQNKINYLVTKGNI